MIGNDMRLDSGVGVCGKEGQSVPVGVGQPTLRIESTDRGRHGLMRLPRRHGLRRLAVASAAAAAFVALLLGGVWLLIPPLAEQELPRLITEQIGRPAAVGRIVLDPLRGQLGIDGLRVDGRDGRPQFTVERVSLELSAETLWRWVPVIASLRIERPALRLTRDAAGRLDIDDILERLAARPSSAEPPPGVLLGNASITDGRIDVDDVRTGIVHRLDGIRVALPFLSTRFQDRDQPVEPTVSLRLDGAVVSAQAALRPFQPGAPGNARLTVSDIDLSAFARHLPADLPVRLAAGRLGAELSATFALPGADGAPALRVEGGLRLDRLALRDPRGDELLTAASVTFGELRLDPFAQRYRVGHVVVDAPVASVRRGAGDARFLEPGDGSGSTACRRRPPRARHRRVRPSPDPSPGRSAGSRFMAGVSRWAMRDSVRRRWQLNLDGVEVAIQDLSSDSALRPKYQVRARVDKGAVLRIAGTLTPAPWSVDGDVRIEALPLQPWWWIAAPRVGFDLTGGSVSAAARYRVAIDAASPRAPPAVSSRRSRSSFPSSHCANVPVAIARQSGPWGWIGLPVGVHPDRGRHVRGPGGPSGPAGGSHARRRTPDGPTRRRRWPQPGDARTGRPGRRRCRHRRHPRPPRGPRRATTACRCGRHLADPCGRRCRRPVPDRPARRGGPPAATSACGTCGSAPASCPRVRPARAHRDDRCAARRRAALGWR
jgi:hypothetical protein